MFLGAAIVSLTLVGWFRPPQPTCGYRTQTSRPIRTVVPLLSVTVSTPGSVDAGELIASVDFEEDLELSVVTGMSLRPVEDLEDHLGQRPASAACVC